MRRIGRASGRETIRTATGVPLAGGYLCDIAERIVGDLQRHVTEIPGLDDHAVAHDTTPPDLLATAHVVLAARAFEVRERSDARSCSPDELPDVLGASIVLGAPRSSAGSFEWWIGQEVGEVVNVLRGKGRGRALMARTLASTFVYAPDLADWQTTELDQMAEHVASVSGALQAWGDHLGYYETIVGTDLEAAATTGDSKPIRDRMRDLARDASRARSMLGQLRPVNLCRNAADRAIVEALQEVAGVAIQEQAVHDGLEVLSAQQDRLVAEAERLRADRERRIEDRQESVQRRLELWLGIIAIIGLIALADFLDQAHDVDGAVIPWIQVVVILAIAAATTFLYARGWKRATDEKADEDKSSWP
jgi:hypothetical protein